MKNILVALVLLVAATCAGQGSIQSINVGSGPATGDGDTVRNGMIKVNSNFSYVESQISTLTEGAGSSLGTLGTSVTNEVLYATETNDLVLIEYILSVANFATNTANALAAGTGFLTEADLTPIFDGYSSIDSWMTAYGYAPTTTILDGYSDVGSYLSANNYVTSYGSLTIVQAAFAGDLIDGFGTASASLGTGYVPMSTGAGNWQWTPEDVVPDSGGNGGTTLHLKASDTGQDMYLHVTSSGGITVTASP